MGLKSEGPRLVFILGKGGVGKSVVAAALARQSARSGRRTLLVQINARDKISPLLGAAAVKETIEEVLPGLFHVNIRPAEALKEYVLLQVKFAIIYRLVFENRAVRYFLRAVPALNDLVVLGKIHFHLNERLEGSDRLKYDRVVVDTPPTGHGLFFLGLPRLLTHVVKSGPIFKEAEALNRFMTDPSLTVAHLVTLPEEMPVRETIETYDRLRRDLKIPLGTCFINGIFPELVKDEDYRRFRSGLAGSSAAPAESGLDLAFSTLRHQRQQCTRYLSELARAIRLPQVQIPLHLAQTHDSTLLDRIEAVLDGSG